jgi:DNA-binding HxlR family transcriptional regulator
VIIDDTPVSSIEDGVTAEPACPSPRAQSLVRDVLEMVGDRWSLQVVQALKDGPVRFTRLMEAVPGVSHRMLTVTLRSLQRDGLVARTAYPESPPRVEYELTPLGVTLRAPVSAFVSWAEEHRTEVESSRERYDP